MVDRLRQPKGGIDFENALDWFAFKELYFRQYFSEAEKEAVIREYANIKQGVTSPSVISRRGF